MSDDPEYRLIGYRGKFAVEFYDEKGIRRRRSLRTTDRLQVDAKLRKIAQEHREARRPERVTVEYAWKEYQKTLGERPAGVTMGFEWKAIGPHFGAIVADAVTEEDCEAYIAKRRKLKRSDGTIWTELGHLRSALKWAERKRHIVRAPAILRPERPAPRDKRLTRSQVKQFLAACDFPHVKLFVTLAMTTGARMGALLDLKWDRVDFAHSQVRLHDPTKPTTNKGRATVPMNKTMRKALEAAKKGMTRGVYVIEWGGGKLGSVKKALRSAGQRSGLPWVTAHVFRHSAATHMAERGVPMAEIAQFLGHSDSRLTERIYARFSPKYLGKAAESLEIDDDEE